MCFLTKPVNPPSFGIFILRAVLRRAVERRAVLRRAVPLRREVLLRRAGLLRLVVFLRRVVFLRFAGDFLRRVVLLRFAGDFLRRVVDLRRVVLLRFAGDFLLRVVDLRRVVFLRFAGDFLRRVVDLRRVVFLRRAGARRRVVDLRAAVFLRLVVVFLLAIFFPPFRVRVLLLRLVVVFRLAAFLAARRFAGLRGFKMTTSCRGIVLNRSQGRLTYKEVGKYDNAITVISTAHLAYSMSTRKQAQNRVKSHPVTVTLDKELLEWLEFQIQNRVFANRSHAVNQAIGFLQWTLKTNPKMFYGERIAQPPQPSRPPQPDKGPNFPR
jgi:hypothetical protein